MYISAKTAERIKLLAKLKNIAIKDMLEQCDLNKNALYTMQSRGSWIQANNLAKIADYLGCSVDYLLGRSDKSTLVAPEYDEGTEKLIAAILELPPEKKKALADLMGIDYE